mmetsp:Transcript_42949/g.98616  ORF Transcript_42949/g.98616 Transcript_42949/m.98616 type:complete len:143 (+) Transcript_42949:301-729(+)
MRLKQRQLQQEQVNIYRRRAASCNTQDSSYAGRSESGRQTCLAAPVEMEATGSGPISGIEESTAVDCSPPCLGSVCHSATKSRRAGGNAFSHASSTWRCARPTTCLSHEFGLRATLGCLQDINRDATNYCDNGKASLTFGTD